MSKIERISTVTQIGNVPQINIDLPINFKNINFEVDTGSGANFISKEVWNKIGKPILSNVGEKFQSASKHPLPVLGCFCAEIKGKDLRFVVADVSNLNILGRSAIKKLEISVDKLMEVRIINSPKAKSVLAEQCKQMCKEFPSLFEPGLGTLKDVQLEIKFKEDAPVFLKPRPVPFALQVDLAAAYEAGIAKGVWKPVQFSNYGTPVVPVKKQSSTSGNSLRVCGDYSVTVNPQLETHRYPIPSPEKLMRKLGCGHGFTKIDLADAYNQICLGPESQKRLALSTHKGVLLQMPLPFGISSAPGYFQEIMDQLTHDLPGVAVYLDDILVSGNSAEDHLRNLRGLLQRLDEKGLCCRYEKCSFAQPSVEYLGHTMSQDGIAKGSKSNAVTKMPSPKDVSELRSFLGQVQFYRKFLPNLSCWNHCIASQRRTFLGFGVQMKKNLFNM